MSDYLGIHTYEYDTEYYAEGMYFFSAGRHHPANFSVTQSFYLSV